MPLFLQIFGNYWRLLLKEEQKEYQRGKSKFSLYFGQFWPFTKNDKFK